MRLPNTNFMRQPNAVGGNPPPAECRGRIGEIEHHLGARCRDALQIEFLGGVLGVTFTDKTLVAFFDYN